MLVYKLIFIMGLLVVLITGIIMFKNFNAWFGPDITMPSENESARVFNKSQFIIIWALAMKLMIMMILVF